ncbi:MAG: hypothetical protein DVB23_002913, partial [Verrucomicrobia bacterium]
REWSDDGIEIEIELVVGIESQNWSTRLIGWVR